MQSLELAGLTNLREVGGYEIDGSRRVRRGRVYRSDAPCHPRPEEVGDLSPLGLATVIDLRSAAEVRRNPTSLPPGTPVIRAEICERTDNRGGNLLEEIVGGRLRRFTTDDLLALYLHMLERSASAFGAAVTALARPQALPALIHCTAGKDRTGLVVALVLDLLGVPREAIVGDYALSTERRAFRRRELEPLLAPHGVAITDLEGLLVCPPLVMAAALAYLDSTYGSVQRYLTGPAGVDPADLAGLVEQLVESNQLTR